MYSCCGITFNSLEELLEHLDRRMIPLQTKHAGNLEELNIEWYNKYFGIFKNKENASNKNYRIKE